jgi:hypothetical protein
MDDDEPDYPVYPEPPRRPDGRSMGPDPERTSGFYEVINVADRAAAYSSIYYWFVGEVIADLLDRLKSDEVKGKWGQDFVIWRDGRILAVLHEPMDDEQVKVHLFNEDRNDPGGTDHRHLPGWPTREQWIERGRGDLWFDRDNPENPAR